MNENNDKKTSKKNSVASEIIKEIFRRYEPIELAIFSAIIFFMMTFAVWVAGIFMTNGEIEYCYVSYSGTRGLFDLEGFRAWRPNTLISQSQTSEKLIEIGKELGCLNKGGN